jgi:hypothetical protein
MSKRDYLADSEAAEMYLETIYRLRSEKGVVRSIDIAREMNYSKPTISEQMKKFRMYGFIETDSDGYITLTPKGEEIASRTINRHYVLTDILVKIGLNSEQAEKDACRIEHYISEEAFECLKKYFNID